jgi:hypothetical protein
MLNVKDVTGSAGPAVEFADVVICGERYDMVEISGCRVVRRLTDVVGT